MKRKPMNNSLRVIGGLWLACILLLWGCANNSSNQICQIEGDEMLLRIEKSWSQQTWDSISKVYDLPRSSLDSIIRFDALGALSKQGWTLAEKTKELVYLVRPMRDMVGLLDPMNLFSVHGKDGKVVPGYPFAMPIPVNYGINYFARSEGRLLRNGKSRFTLPGYPDARAVYLSGSFNSWSTLATPMHRSADGWVADIALEPGKYIYRFIIDGHWIEDPLNPQHEPNEFDSFNSVYFCSNHRFSLPGFGDAKKVVVTGSFNNWNEEELQMKRGDGGWYLDLYLKEGIYPYKFKVDDRWYLDPANPRQQPDGQGHENSVLGVGDTTYFRLAGFREAREVRLAGDFTDWYRNSIPMRRTATGWEWPAILPAGNYMYKFIADGEWMTDPRNAHRIHVGEGLNSVLSVKPNKTFFFKGSRNARQVILSGSFNEWNETGYTLERVADGWQISLYLPPGKYLYKFIIDGNWSLDPANPLWEENEHGTGNSVLWIEAGMP